MPPHRRQSSVQWYQNYRHLHIIIYITLGIVIILDRKILLIINFYNFQGCIQEYRLESTLNTDDLYCVISEVKKPNLRRTTLHKQS